MDLNRFELNSPLVRDTLLPLRVGDEVMLSGKIYVMRDAVCARIFPSHDSLPFPSSGSIVYFAGPAPAPPGRSIGSLGPTSSYRMEPYIPELLKSGVKVLVGKGQLGLKTVELLKKQQAVYLAALGGAGALLSRAVVSAKVIAMEELGAEALRELVVQDFPARVAVDLTGESLFLQVKKG